MRASSKAVRNLACQAGPWHAVFSVWASRDGGKPVEHASVSPTKAHKKQEEGMYVQNVALLREAAYEEC